ncbi:cucumber peeling cupredoxin-like [Melia azedarach]|uniref:Cucumber peeling cupredoxin-like n=1 Tax=Melia azedarach TaxID=155640 RepID=A0ACC1Y5W2_MELAZ|nr:cucumber peeling cupredoxin-like [Melia azedarach]
MEKFVCIALVGVLAVALMECAAAKTVHVVGDSMGWTIPTSGEAGAYDTWAASKKFVVGDVLTFNFVKNEHDVLQVPKASYDGCSSSNPIGNLITDGPANITLNSTGEHYFICTFGRHCQVGQKLAITVSAASPPGSSPSPSSNPTPPTTTPNPTSPSPNSGTPVDCTPAPTSGPTPGSHTGSVPPSSPTNNIPDSSSPVVLASALVFMLAVLMHCLFF